MRKRSIRRLTRSEKREEIAGYLFILPWLIGFLAFTAGPMVFSLVLSLFKAHLFSPVEFIGLRNYIDLFSFDDTVSLFWKTLWNTGYYTFLSVPLSLMAGFMVALLLNRKIKFLGLFRTIYYLPAVVSGAAVALLWLWILNPEYGILNYVLSLFGVKGPGWVYTEEWAKPALIVMSLWGSGGSMLIYLAGLQGIPTQLYEAAEIDGASSWQKLLRVTLPMMTPTIFFTLVMGIIGSFQIFTAAYMMTGGGPNNATMMYVLYLYNLAFKQMKMGLASALAWIYFGMIMMFVVLIFKSSPAWVYYETEVLKGRK